MPVRIAQLPVPPSVSDDAPLVDPWLPDELPLPDPVPGAPWPPPLPGAEDELDAPLSPGLLPADWPAPDEAPFDEPPRLPEEAPASAEPSEFVEPMSVREGLFPHAKSRNANELTVTFDPIIQAPPRRPNSASRLLHFRAYQVT
jgi:hypothetical protein